MKRLVLAVIAVVMTICMNAAPAFRGAVKMMQADGTWITVEQYGDEYHHWTMTSDGVMVVNTGKGYYVADIDEQGRVTASDVLAHEKSLRTAAEQVLVSRQLSRHNLFHKRGQSVRRAMSISEGGKYLPHSGSPRVLTILAAYQDVGFTVNEPEAAFNQILNGNEIVDFGNHNTDQNSSVRQYFETSSKNQFSPQFEIVGPVTLPKTMAYYGGTKTDGTDDKFSEFCRDAIAEVKAQNLVEDWSVYDNDGDGNIELVCVIFAGYGQNQGGETNTMWAKASTQNQTVTDQLTITRFNCSCELFHPRREGYINGTGVFIHEMSHCLGLPDLYATQTSGIANNQGMETWDIMDYGLYNNNSFAPSPYNAWEQEVMGWTEIEPLTIDAEQGIHHIDVTGMLPLIEEGGKAYKIVNENNDCNYIVLENMQKRGLNESAYGHGLLAYQVNYPYQVVSMGDSPNNITGHPAVAVVPATGLLINKSLKGKNKEYSNEDWEASLASSTFPGTKNVTELYADMALPNYVFHDNRGAKDTRSILVSLRNITESEDGIISFCFSDGTEEPDPENPDGIQNVAMRQESIANGQYFDLQGRRVANGQQPKAKGLYIINGKKVIK